MSVRRKSNWYIYFISFGIATVFAVAAILAFKWYLFPEKSNPVGLDKNGELTENFRPTDEQRFNMLAMMSDGATDVPGLFMLITYDAVDNVASFIPLPNGISVPLEERTLPNVYAAQGAEKVVAAIEDAVGVSCDFYVKTDRHSFMNLISSFGNVNYDVPKTVIVRDGDVAETINAGSQRITADTFYRLVMLADFEEGESYRFNCIGSIFSDLINQNFRNVDSSLLDTYYRLITDNTETDLTEQKYKAHKAALLNTVEYGVYPAEYYVPYGEYGSDGGFIISENSIITIKQKAGIL